MNMSWIDWTIVAVFMVCLGAVAIYTRQYVGNVSGFLVANRCAGRYLLSISQDIASLAAISFVAWFEMYYESGFCATWWMMMTMPIGLFVTLSGWIAYRYRETRVMTLAQLFEIRYSRRFRVFSGILVWLTGVINMGIFPAVTARFFIYFCGLPKTFGLFGMEISTFATIMIIELSIALLFTFLGGMVVVMVTDFIQGIFCNIIFLVILAVLFLQFDWSQIISSLKMAPPDASMLNPFKTTKAEGFNLTFFLIMVFTTFYGHRTWQGTQGYNAAAKNAHEAKMAGILGQWRSMTQKLLVMMLPICAYTLMHHSDFTLQAQSVQQAVDSIQVGSQTETIQNQMLVPLALTKMLPVGILGLFCAVMLASAVSTDDSYLHSWGSIFIQDVIMPFRKKTISQAKHVWLLRFSILFVALFIFTFSLFFKQNDYILMYFTLTGAIYVGGAGAVLVGGLYWNRGSTAGAWGAMIVGGVLAGSGLTIQMIWAKIVPTLMNWFPNWQFLVAHNEKFPYNGMQISFFAILCAISVYIGFSLWDWLVLRRPAFNMDQMLHRGKYAIKDEHGKGVTRPVTGLRAILPGKEFTGSDKFFHIALTVWIGAWFIFFVAVTVYHLVFGTSESFWVGFWFFKVILTVVLGTGTTIWFVIGGMSDLKDLFRSLRSVETDSTDDGRVVDHHNLADERKNIIQ